jgi:hypothetical protein
MYKKLIIIILFFLIVNAGCKNAQISLPLLNEIPKNLQPIKDGDINVQIVDPNNASFSNINGMSLNFIPPDDSATMVREINNTGFCQFIPNSGELQMGNWTVIAALTPNPLYAPSVANFAVTENNQLLQFSTAPTSIVVTPPSILSYTGTSGGVFVYKILYVQPGNLLVPVHLYIPTLATNWKATAAPTTMGINNDSNAYVTVSGQQCVDDPSVSVTIFAIDSVSNTSNYRTESILPSIVKDFNSTVSVTWQSTSLTNGFYTCSSGIQLILSGTLKISAQNACSSNVSVNIQWSGGSCSSDYLETPYGNISNIQTGGGSINLSCGTYNVTFYTGWSPLLICTLNSSPTKPSNTVALALNGSTICLNASY